MKNVLIFSLLNLFIFLPFLEAEIIVDGFTDKDIQKAIDRVSEKGGGIVSLPKGTYLLNNAIYMKDNVELEGQGKNTLLRKNRGHFTSIILIKKNIIQVGNASGFEVGYGISIVTESIQPKPLLTKIVAKKNDEFIIEDPINPNDFILSHPNIYSSFPCIFCRNVKKVSIKNLAIDGNMRNNYVINSWWDSGIGIVDSYDVKIDNVYVNNAAGDGISLNNSHHVSIKNSSIINSARLGVHVGSGSKYTYMTNTIIENSGVAGKINFDGLYLCFDASFGVYKNNEIKNNRGSGISLGWCDSDNTFINNKIIGNEIGIHFRQDTHKTFNVKFRENIFADNQLDLKAEKPIQFIFIKTSARLTKLKL